MQLRAPLIRAFDHYVMGRKFHTYGNLLHQHYLLPQDMQFSVQRGNLTRLLQHAAKHVPYYREILHSTVVADANNEIDLSRFHLLPLLTKDIIREQFDEVKSEDLALRHWNFNSTGGSTGEPLQFIQDYESSQLSLAVQYFTQQQAGAQLGDNIIMLWGSHRDITQGSYGWRARISGFLRNTHFLNSFRMSPEAMSSYVSIIKKKRPKLIVAYVDGIYELSRFINSHGLDIPNVGAIITGAGTLLPSMRAEIERAFGCEVFNRYGSREMGNIAFDHASHDYLEVSTYTHLIEIVDQAGNPCLPGQEGEVIVTNLMNFAMPFIRYRIGDTAIVNQKAEDPINSVTSMKNVTGRVVDSFIRRDGTIISPFFFIHFIGVVHNSGWAKKIQIVQHDYDQIEVKLLVEIEPTSETLCELETALKKGIGEDCSIVFTFVDDLPPSESGKYRYTLSLVERDL